MENGEKSPLKFKLTEEERYRQTNYREKEVGDEEEMLQDLFFSVSRHIH